MPDMPDDQAAFQPHPELDVVLDVTALRALAHPVRVRALGLLRTDGPSTATKLAERLGLNSGATSYHLRQLAGVGLIVEDSERGNARERWWRAAHRSTWWDFSASDADEESGLAYLRAIAMVQSEHMQRSVEELPTLPDEWRQVGTMSDFLLRLTPAEAEELVQEVCELIARQRRDQPEPMPDAPADARPFHVQLQAFLRPGAEVGPGLDAKSGSDSDTDSADTGSV